MKYDEVKANQFTKWFRDPNQQDNPPPCECMVHEKCTAQSTTIVDRPGRRHVPTCAHHNAAE